MSPLPLLAGHGPAGEAARAGRAAQPWLPTLRSPPGAGLMERIQAIAQNVSDIAVKVDQILRHSLLLHSKGGAGAPRDPRRRGGRAGYPGWGPDFPTAAAWVRQGPVLISQQGDWGFSHPDLA